MQSEVAQNAPVKSAQRRKRGPRVLPALPFGYQALDPVRSRLSRGADDLAQLV
jgi:hypothetical protein